MPATVRSVDYFYVTVQDKPGEAYRVLSELATHDVNLLAFGAVPVGPVDTQITVFPEDTGRLANALDRLGLSLHGPHSAFLVQGDDNLGALVDIHRKLSDAGVNIYASTGVTDGVGRFGYVVYVKPEQFARAAEVLGARWSH